MGRHVLWVFCDTSVSPWNEHHMLGHRVLSYIYKIINTVIKSFYIVMDANIIIRTISNLEITLPYCNHITEIFKHNVVDEK